MIINKQQYGVKNILNLSITFRIILCYTDLCNHLTMQQKTLMPFIYRQHYLFRCWHFLFVVRQLGLELTHYRQLFYHSIVKWPALR